PPGRTCRATTRSGRRTRGRDGRGRGGGGLRRELPSRRVADPVGETAAGNALVGLDVALAGGLHQAAGQRRRGRAGVLVPAGLRRRQPVAHVLLVERRVDLALHVGVRRPVAGGVR